MTQWESQVVDNNQLTTISELTPHTIYTIRVQAFTSVGPGPLSAPVHVKTQQGKQFVILIFNINITFDFFKLYVYIILVCELIVD